MRRRIVRSARAIWARRLHWQSLIVFTAVTVAATFVPASARATNSSPLYNMYALGALPDGATDNYPICSNYINENASEATRIPAGSTIYFPAVAGSANNYVSSSGYLINRSMNLVCDPGVTLTLNGVVPYGGNFYLGGLVPNKFGGISYPASANVCDAGLAPLPQGNTTYVVDGCSSPPMVGQNVFLNLGLDNHDFAVHMTRMFTTIETVSGNGPWTVVVKDPLPQDVAPPDWNNTPYMANALIRPRNGNPNNFIYQNTSGIDGCVPGTNEPTIFNQTPGGSTIDGTCVWTNEYTQSDFPTVPTFARSPTYHEFVTGLPSNFSVSNCTFAQVNDTSIPYDPALYFGRTTNVTLSNVSVTSARLLAYFFEVAHGTINNVSGQLVGMLPAGQLLGFSGSSDFTITNYSAYNTMGSGIYIESYSHDLSFNNGYLSADPNQQAGVEMFGVNGASQNITSNGLEINMGQAQSVRANFVDIDSQAQFANTVLDGPNISGWDMRYEGAGPVTFQGQQYQPQPVKYRKTYVLQSGFNNRRFSLPNGLYASLQGSINSTAGVRDIILGNSSGDAVALYQRSGPAINLFPTNGVFGDLNSIVDDVAGAGVSGRGRYEDDALNLGQPNAYPFNYYSTDKYVRFDTGNVKPGTKVILQFEVFVPSSQ